MLILEFLGALVIFALICLFFAILAIPIVFAVALVVAAVKLALFIVLVPFRLVGWVFGLAFGR
jgi:hypothetical protein